MGVGGTGSGVRGWVSRRGGLDGRRAVGAGVRVGSGGWAGGELGVGVVGFWVLRDGGFRRGVSAGRLLEVGGETSHDACSKRGA